MDKRWIGHALPDYWVEVERGRLKFFARAIGQTDPVYTDEDAARAAGHPALPVPPTFLFCLEHEAPRPTAMRDLLGIDISKVLHGEQRFVYHAMCHAGDRLHYAPRIADIYDKKGGALQFVVRETRVSDAQGRHVADLVSTTVVRNG